YGCEPAGRRAHVERDATGNGNREMVERGAQLRGTPQRFRTPHANGRVVRYSRARIGDDATVHVDDAALDELDGIFIGRAQRVDPVEERDEPTAWSAHDSSSEVAGSGCRRRGGGERARQNPTPRRGRARAGLSQT